MHNIYDQFYFSYFCQYARLIAARNAEWIHAHTHTRRESRTPNEMARTDAKKRSDIKLAYTRVYGVRRILRTRETTHIWIQLAQPITWKRYSVNASRNWSREWNCVARCNRIILSTVSHSIGEVQATEYCYATRVRNTATETAGSYIVVDTHIAHECFLRDCLRLRAIRARTTWRYKYSSVEQRKTLLWFSLLQFCVVGIVSGGPTTSIQPC